MTQRKMDHEVVTGWEKRIKVDYGSIGPNHPRWSDWTYKERDIVARKVHEITGIQQMHGSRSKRAEEWAKENAPIMTDFARDGKPMPPWAHAEYRESGVPVYVGVEWKRETPGDPASMGDWAYNIPGPWSDPGPEPMWSARPMEPDHDPNEIVGLETKGSMDPKFGGVVSYKEMANGDHVATDGTVISTRESRAREDMPQWQKFETGRLEIVDDVVIPGPNALPEDEARYGKNRALTNIHKTRQQHAPVAQFDKIMPDDPNYTPLEKALNWAAETHHGEQHRSRWRGAAAALGATPAQLIAAGGDGTAIPMTMEGARKWWKHFGQNARWSMLVDALENGEGVLSPPVPDEPEDDLAVIDEEIGAAQDSGEYMKFDPDTLTFRPLTEDEKRIEELDRYHNAPAMQGHFTVEEWERMHGSSPTIVRIRDWRQLAIIDPGIGVPNYWLEGDGQPTATWVREGDEWLEIKHTEQDLISTRSLVWKDGGLAYPVEVPHYPEGASILHAQASAGGRSWVRMPALEGGEGRRYQIFLVPKGYEIEKQDFVRLRFWFDGANAEDKYISRVEKVPSPGTESKPGDIIEGAVATVGTAIVSRDETPPQWRLHGSAEYGTEPPGSGDVGWYTREADWLPSWYLALPEMTFEEAKANGMTERQNVAPLHFMFIKGEYILGRQKMSEERTDLPIWTEAQAIIWYRKNGILLTSRCWLDGHRMTRPGYTDDGTHKGTPIARAADEEYEAQNTTVTVPCDLAEALERRDMDAIMKILARD